MPSTGLEPRLLLLSPDDNVVVVRQRLRAGDRVAVGGREVTLFGDVPLGHKLAFRPIGPGDKVLKYGAPIGSATAAIAQGEHVHVHNLQSDYTPTYTLDEARAKHGDAA